MKESAKIFDEIVNERRSVRIFDKDAPFDPDSVQRSLERAVLSPSSSNMQLWEFYRIVTKEKKEKIAEFCFNQNAAKTAIELIVVVVRSDKWYERQQFNYNQIIKNGKNISSTRLRNALDYYGKLIPMAYFNDPLGVWGGMKKIISSAIGLVRPMVREVTGADMRVVAHKSVALAAQTFMLSIKAEGYDSCPMEGFDSDRVKNFLKLPSGSEISMVIGVGPRKNEGVYGQRIRVDNSEVIFKL
ncbi:MAG: nitroreductase family protein [Leptospiraceae bacterium]|nr:nitroreductase family protein [Leptospiraceae bacterium]